jgi:hypothetical protein
MYLRPPEWFQIMSSGVFRGAFRVTVLVTVTGILPMPVQSLRMIQG